MNVLCCVICFDFIVYIFKSGNDIDVTVANIHSGKFYPIETDPVFKSPAERNRIDRLPFRIRDDLLRSYSFEEALAILFKNKL